MSRELNRDIFGELNSTQRPAQRPHAESAPAVSAEDLKIMSYQVESLSKKLKEFESKFEVLGSRWDEIAASTKLRFERIQSHFQRQGEAIQSNFREVHSKVAQMGTKLNEKRMSEASIKEMVERHSSVVQSFEVRLNQMQKVLSEQELQLLNSRAELKDAQKELARLKKF
jgi:chromosome segregation ATPase